MRARALITFALAAILALGACRSDEGVRGNTSDVKSPESTPTSAPDSTPTSSPAKEDDKDARTELAPPPQEGEAVATFAGGCFWCMEPPFEKLDGVRAVLSGYTAGKVEHPSYEHVCTGETGHTEAVIVYFDPARVSYDKLLDTFWRSMDPTDFEGQFADRGNQYRPTIFYHSPEQQTAAEASKKALGESARFKKPIAVPIEAAQPFWVAEGYHQDYYKKNAAHYNRYRAGSGRAGFLKDTWGDEAH